MLLLKLPFESVGFGVNTCLKLAVLKNSSDWASSLCWVHDPTTPPCLHWELWVLKDGGPGCFSPRLKVRGARVGRCFLPGAEQLLDVFVTRVPSSCRGWSPELGADAFLPPKAAASSSVTESWHPRGAVSYDEFGSVLLLPTLEISAPLFILINLYK